MQRKLRESNTDNMAFTIELDDGCYLPMIGFNLREVHDEWEEQLDWVLHHSEPYFEVPISGHLSEAVMRRIGRHAHVNSLKRHHFIIATSISVPEDPSAAVALVKEFVAHFGTHIDLLYLENPIGLKGTDPMIIYKTSPTGTHPDIRKVTHMFQRIAQGYLKVAPRIMQDLNALWKILEQELVEVGAVHRLGLRHFTRQQVEDLLKGGVQHHPLALQAEVNPYCDQYDLLSWCHDANIPLVAIHPFGSPIHVPSNDAPFLWEHPKVIKMAERVGVGPKVILSRRVLQSGLRMVYDNTELLLPNFMTENIWRFQLTQGQMNKLGKLNKSLRKHPMSKYDFLLVADPIWPFLPGVRKKEEEVENNKFVNKIMEKIEEKGKWNMKMKEELEQKEEKEGEEISIVKEVIGNDVKKEIEEDETHNEIEEKEEKTNEREEDKVNEEEKKLNE